MPVFYQPDNKSPEKITQVEAEEIIRAVAENDATLAKDGVASDAIGTLYFVPKSPPYVDGKGNTSQTGGTAS